MTLQRTCLALPLLLVIVSSLSSDVPNRVPIEISEEPVVGERPIRDTLKADQLQEGVIQGNAGIHIEDGR